MRRSMQFVNADGTLTEVHAYDLTMRDIHIDGPLSNIIVAYRPAQSIVDKIFPMVPVAKESDLYYKFEQADLWRVPDTVRARLTAAKMADFNVSSDNYHARNYALATGVAVEDAVNADDVLRLRENKALFIKDLLQLDWENRVATLVVNTSNVGTWNAPQSLWSDHDNSSPEIDIDNGIENIRDATGYTPNKLVLGWRAWRHLRRNANVRAQIFPSAGGGTGPGIPTLAQVAELFGVEEVMVGGVMRNTAAEGLSQTLADIWGPHALLYYSPGRPSKETPAYGYSFRWSAPGLPNMQVENHGFDKKLKGEILEVGYYQDEKIVGSNLATLIGSVSAT